MYICVYVRASLRVSNYMHVLCVCVCVYKYVHMHVRICDLLH